MTGSRSTHCTPKVLQLQLVNISLRCRLQRYITLTLYASYPLPGVSRLFEEIYSMWLCC